MYTQIGILIVMLCALGQRPVPMTAAGTFMSDEQSDKVDALYEQIQEIEAKREEEKARNLDTTKFDAEIARLQGELKAIEGPYQDETLRPFIPAVQKFTAEIDTFAGTLSPVSAMTIEQADQMVDFLYRDVGHPQANGRGQFLTFHYIRPLVEEPILPEEVRERFRSRLMEFHQAGGGQSHLIVMAYLGESLYLTSRPGDASLQAARDLINDSQQRLREAGRFRDQEKFLQSSLAAQKLQEIEGQVTAVTGKEAVSVTELSALSAATIKGFSLSDGRDRSLIVLLREYRRMLRNPKLKSEIVKLIEADLITIAQLPPIKDNPEWKHWRLWAEAGSLLSKRATAARATTAMAVFVEKELERLRAGNGKAPGKTAQFKAISYVKRKCTSKSEHKP